MAWRTGLALVLGTSIGGGQETEEEAAASAAVPKAQLFWNNGESIPGAWVGADPGTIVWRSPLFQEPVPLAVEELRFIEIPVARVVEELKAVQAMERGDFAVRLKNGDHLSGDIVGATEATIKLKSARHGDIELKWDQIASLRRLRGAGVLHGGPGGLTGWTSVEGQNRPGPATALASAWFPFEGGGLATQRWNAAVRLPLQAPALSQIHLRLRASEIPDFSLTLASAKIPFVLEVRDGLKTQPEPPPALGPGAPFVLETWDTLLVLKHGADFHPLIELKAGEVLDLRLCWDQAKNRLSCYNANGTLLGMLDTGTMPAPASGGAAAPAPDVSGIVIAEEEEPAAKGIAPIRTPEKEKDLGGFTLRNKGRDLVLEQFLVREWAGEAPDVRASSVGRAWAEAEDGDLLSGDLRPSEKDLGLRVGGKTLPFGKLIAYDAPVVLEPVARVPGTQLRFSDGTILTGALAAIQGREVRLETGYAAGALPTRLEGLVRVAMPESRADEGAEETPARTALASMDLLRTTSFGSIHGTLEGSGDAVLRWRPIGGEKSVALAPVGDLEVRRPAPKDPPAAAASSLLFLENGDVVSGHLQSIAGDTIAFESHSSGRLEISGPELRALHLGARPVKGQGFADPGWRQVRGAEKAVEIKGDRVSIDTDGAFGHPTILQGDELRFTMGVEMGWGAVGVDLFVDDLEARSRGVTLRFFYSGDELYCLYGTDGDGLRGDQSISNLRGQQVNIRVLAKGDTLQVFAREKRVLETKMEPGLRRGSGVLFYPSEMWGNAARKVEVAGFSMQSNPGFVNVPAVNEEARGQALTVPRFRRETPPTHLLLAPNGDLLRGAVVSATARIVRFRSGLEEVDIPWERVASLIWLRPPVEESAPAPRPQASANPAPSHWLVLRDGSQFGLQVSQFTDKELRGESSALGSCVVPFENLHSLRLTAPPASPAAAAYGGWTLRYAPEPVLPESGGQSNSLLGKSAPLFKLPMLAGGQFDLAQQRGKVVVLDFWATWCGPCVQAMPGFIETMRGFASDQVAFVAVNEGESADTIKNFLSQRQWELPVALDARQEAGRLYGVEGIPFQAVINPAGQVVWVQSGFRPGGHEALAQAIREALKNPAPPAANP